MGKYLIPEDDGLPARTSGQWVTEKLHYLKRYIYMFETSMRNKPWRRRNYIDLFAGPGKCIISQTGEFHLGSPLLALTTEHPFTDYYFVDADQKNIDILQERCDASLVPANIHYFVGDSNVDVQTIVDQIVQIDRSFIKGQWPSISLAFLDPEGLEIGMEHHRYLSSSRKDGLNNPLFAERSNSEFRDLLQLGRRNNN